MIDFFFFSWLNAAFTGPPHPNGVLVLWMKWPKSQMTVLIWPGRQDNIYELACPCILCCPLSPSTRNAWVMAYLYTIIRQTHTSPLTVKSHQYKTHKQAHTWLAAALTQLQSLFTGGGLEWMCVCLWGWWGGDEKNGKQNYYISCESAASEGCACKTNSAEPSIQLRAAHAFHTLSAIYFNLHQ